MNHGMTVRDKTGMFILFLITWAVTFTLLIPIHRIEGKVDTANGGSPTAKVQRYEDNSMKIRFNGNTCYVPAFDSVSDHVICKED
jgi:hypothetical protein